MQVSTGCVNPAERNALWDRYMDWFIYLFTFLKNLPYESVLEKFIPKFIEVMNLILEIKKYVDESLARSKILELPTIEQVLTQIGAEIPSTQFLAFQRDVEASIGITIPEQNLVVPFDVITSFGIFQNIDS